MLGTGHGGRHGRFGRSERQETHHRARVAGRHDQRIGLRADRADQGRHRFRWRCLVQPQLDRPRQAGMPPSEVD
ncbi:hypothetical protein chiPu_0033758 [Chiloscyllium punctatum]|uniref:Uncharacterized protein n=1 Tax=Chiloscyllium punctatum TaxID=137246 RepID=A0A401U3T1_CHIPU|nr:hypothetical protein [Chiloscyllium punctatum]